MGLTFQPSLKRCVGEGGGAFQVEGTGCGRPEPCRHAVCSGGPRGAPPQAQLLEPCAEDPGPVAPSDRPGSGDNCRRRAVSLAPPSGYQIEKLSLFS